MKPQSRTIIISPVTPIIFNQLYLKYAETLSCPCSTVTIPYSAFVNNTITFHPICSSIFVSQQWIQALYFPNASTYGVPDFRTTASSQFELLASFCSYIQNIMFENQIDLDNNEFISIYLQTEMEVQSQVNATIELFKSRISVRIISFLNYLKITTEANFLVSALNTNLLIITSYLDNDYPVSLLPVMYSANYDTNSPFDYSYVMCANANPFTITGFFSFSTEHNSYYHSIWFPPELNSTLVNGFFAGCTPLEGLLRSTLDCLYDMKCIKLLYDYFPALNQINFNGNHSILHEKEGNISVNEFLSDLFVEKQSIAMNYSKYFNQCASKFCTYTTTDQIDFSYAITLFISLYGGLIIILRLIASFLINFIFKCHPRNRIINLRPLQIHIHSFVKSMKRLNLFKNVDERMENSIKQQKLITRVYLVLLTGSILILLFFNSLSTQTITIIDRYPSLNAYNELQIMYTNTVKCPCSKMTIPYRTFISIFPVLHQVCSSDFITDRWISILNQSITNGISIDWRNRAFSQAQLLSNLCQLANETINDAINRFLSQYFITSSVLTENEFDEQINSTFNQFFQTTTVYFGLLVQTVRLLMQVDQPFMGPMQVDTELSSNLITNNVKNTINNQQLLQAGTRDINSTLVNCICATNPNCKSAVAIYDINHIDSSHFDFNIAYVVPGSYVGCSVTESLLLSTLECFYSSSDCFVILMNYIQEMYLYNVENPLWFDVQPLNYDRMLSRYPPNTSISIIIKEMMIEQWNSSFSYKHFYESCAPSYCTYPRKVHTKTIIGVLITMIAMIGGLIISLRLITPQLIKFITSLLTMIIRRQQQQRQPSNL
ncbi:unnamed protein product [Adineta steineri]|uniref:Uncharacterized protein n=1 Tax=Adineta steineri TaxID=433720 RepID=A0A815LLC9_9BILA|nr:unnamed protein product [Adineta steineri]CAF1408888.1 unnamed protein product [Adineta steineri]CAF3949566.1 unnamed protein product [Adineta steineri]CAF3966326.1 unnamed protein product [Adineta steineri]